MIRFLSISPTSFSLKYLLVCSLVGLMFANVIFAEDYIREVQLTAVQDKRADWGRWGAKPDRYSGWTNHSNRLIPVYTFGIDLKAVKGEKSIYRNEAALTKIYGRLPKETLNPNANYFDQTDIYRLQKQAIAAGKKHVFLFIFDGMDWQTTQAAAIYRSGKVYQSGRGSGLHFLDYNKTLTDYGYMVTSPHNIDTKVDVNSQIVTTKGGEKPGGYSAEIAGTTPWSKSKSDVYLLGAYRNLPHAVTDSASSATSMTCGIKTFNAAINVNPDGDQTEPIARWLQREMKFAIGVVTSVPISHATPAAAYANNVSRNDYQDLSRDLLGLPAISHRNGSLPGVDVLLGGGYGELTVKDPKQGENYLAGGKFIADQDVKAADVENGGEYVVALRTAERQGAEVLRSAAQKAVAGKHRLFGLFGTKKGHLPYQTADGKYNPTRGAGFIDVYQDADVNENPTLAEMTSAALQVLEQNEAGFWLMVEAGDVDWANHNNNLDDSIGAVLSGDDAVKSITDWIEKNDAWTDSALIVTADHGHYLVMDDLNVLLKPKN